MTFDMIETVGRPVPGWLITEGFFEEVIGPIKTGKEGMVSLVRRWDGEKECLLALKEYRDPLTRSFKRDEIYREGWHFNKRPRLQQAFDRGGKSARAPALHRFNNNEFVILKMIWEAGGSVPYPVDGYGQVLMQYLGSWERAAPRLVEARLTKAQAKEALQLILENVRLFADFGIVHADLSAFNILWWEERSWIIDFPQSVGIGENPHAFDLLNRDLTNIAKYFSKFGLELDPGEEVARVVSRYSL